MDVSPNRPPWPPGRPAAPPIAPPSCRWTLPTHGPLDETDIVAVGADLKPGTVLQAYRTGLFPMPIGRRRLAWFSPDPRGVLPLDGVHVSRSLRRSMRNFSPSIDTAFGEVMAACADPSRAGGWINAEIISSYSTLHDLGWAHSVEVRDHHDQLVGGLYGVRIGGLFAAESKFHRATDASKAAVVYLVEWLRATGAVLVDVQWSTPHLSTLGVIEIPRSEYLAQLKHALVV